MKTNTSSSSLQLHLHNSIYTYDILGLTLTKEAVPELESREYGAFRFELEGKGVIFRVAKLTPIKVGYFVTVWKKINGINAPFNSNDLDFIIIHVKDEDKQGQFIFDKNILIDKGIISHNNIKNGKMAFRVYPPWVNPVAKQAILTQRWQTKYFLNFEPHNLNDKNNMFRQRLYNLLNI